MQLQFAPPHGLEEGAHTTFERCARANSWNIPVDVDIWDLDTRSPALTAHACCTPPRHHIQPWIGLTFRRLPGHSHWQSQIYSDVLAIKHGTRNRCRCILSTLLGWMMMDQLLTHVPIDASNGGANAVSIYPLRLQHH